MKKNYYFATWLRAFSAILILLCHYAPESSNAYIKPTGQFFNIGVEIFLILSGFLFGIQKNPFKGDIWNWYKKRLKRIYIPLELFLVVLFIVYLICGKQIQPSDWLFMALGLKGVMGSVKGAGHTWFVTAILLCYLVTPLVGKLSLWLEKQKNKCVIVVFAAGGGYHSCPFGVDSGGTYLYFGCADCYI